MINDYFTDIVKIVSVKTDRFGATTETESADLSAKVFDKCKMMLGKDGREVMPSMKIYLDKSAAVYDGDKIKIVKKNGNDYKQPEKLWQIITIIDAGGFEDMFKAVYVGN